MNLEELKSVVYDLNPYHVANYLSNANELCKIINEYFLCAKYDFYGDEIAKGNAIYLCESVNAIWVLISSTLDNIKQGIAEAKQLDELHSRVIQ